MVRYSSPQRKCLSTYFLRPRTTTVSGTVTVTATAADSSGIASVQFQVDSSNLGAADTTSPYSQSWNTTTVVDGPHTLRLAAGKQNRNAMAKW